MNVAEIHFSPCNLSSRRNVFLQLFYQTKTESFSVQELKGWTRRYIRVLLGTATLLPHGVPEEICTATEIGCHRLTDINKCILFCPSAQQARAGSWLKRSGTDEAKRQCLYVPEELNVKC